MIFSGINSSSFNGTQDLDMIYDWCKNYSTAPLVWTGLGVIFYLIGFPADLIVLHELLQRQKQKVSNDIFTFSLAVIDLSFTAYIPIGVCNFMIWHIIQCQWISNFIYSLILIGRPLLMACICGDCYVAVVHPILYITSKKLSDIRKMISLAVWIVIVAYGGLITCKMWMIITPLTSVPLIIALPVIAYCDISIYQALRKPDPSGKSNIHPQKKRALYVIFTSFIMTFIAYLPPAVIFSFGMLIFDTQIERFCDLLIYGVCFIMAGCVIMPILYLDSVGKLDTFKEWWKQ